MSQSEESTFGSAGSPKTAKWFGDMSQADFDIDFYERVVERSPNFVQVLRLLGEMLARKGLYERSLAIDRRLITLVPHDGVAHYNFACSLSMCGCPQEAISELRAAIEYGYQDFGYLEMDSDLDSLRNDPEFKALLRRHGKKGRRRKEK